jgi:hypothetical protein
VHDPDKIEVLFPSSGLFLYFLLVFLCSLTPSADADITREEPEGCLSVGHSGGAEALAVVALEEVSVEASVEVGAALAGVALVGDGRICSKGQTE